MKTKAMESKGTLKARIAAELERRMVFARDKAAQAWCQKTTSKKEMDTVLAEAFARILVKEMYEPRLGCATTAMLLGELSVRCDLGYSSMGGEDRTVAAALRLTDMQLRGRR